MLSKLYIKNFAIIEELDLQFPAGLIALTGETGAGKSIILGAINLLLGARADSNSLLNKTEKCVIEATFLQPVESDVNVFLHSQEIEVLPEIIIRREIQASGRSRAFINDTPVVLSVLESVGEMLIDLHRQFDTLEIKNKNFQLQLLDTIAENENLLKEYTTYFATWKQAKKQLGFLQQEQLQMQQEQDYNQFLLDELLKINLQPNEVEQAEQELTLLSKAEEIKTSLAKVNFLLQNGEAPLTSQIKNCVMLLNQYSNSVQLLTPLTERLQSVYIELKDVCTELEDLEETVQVDEEKLNQVLDRFNEGTRLLKKHGALDTNTLIKTQADLEQKVNKFANADASINAAKEAMQIANLSMQKAAAELHKKRKKAATYAMQQVNEMLPKVGMPAAQMQINMQAIECSSYGADEVLFTLDANKTNQFLPIAKAASGGELSRIMLCLKSLLAKATNWGTLIFDEIDTGISGEVAKQVGVILQQLAKHHQIVTVTHLPQIAAKANHHLYVYKAVSAAGHMQTSVKSLAIKERIAHIAEMLSGTEPTTTALQAAKELMNQ